MPMLHDYATAQAWHTVCVPAALNHGRKINFPPSTPRLITDRTGRSLLVCLVHPSAPRQNNLHILGSSVVEEVNSDIYKLKILTKLKSTFLMPRNKCVEIL